MENLVLYYTFIESCRNKKYECTHKHHIIPKFMGGKKEKHNEILLGYEDHQLAHIILAKCFAEGSRNYIYNINTAAKLNGWVDNIKQNIDLKELCRNLKLGKTYEELYGEEKADEIKEKLKKHWNTFWSNLDNRKRMSEIKIGDLNPMFGMKFSDETIKKMSDNKKEWWKSLTKEELNIISKQHSIQMKNWWKSLTPEQLSEHIEKLSNSMKKWWETAPEEILIQRSKKLSLSLKGRIFTEEHINNIKKNHADISGEKNPMYGKKHKSSTCLKIGIANKGNNKCGGRLGKTFSLFKFYKNEIFIYEAKGQEDAKQFCKNNQINYQSLCKTFDNWKEWKCIRNHKNQYNETVS